MSEIKKILSSELDLAEIKDPYIALETNGNDDHKRRKVYKNIIFKDQLLSDGKPNEIMGIQHRYPFVEFINCELHSIKILTLSSSLIFKDCTIEKIVFKNGQVNNNYRFLQFDQCNITEFEFITKEFLGKFYINIEDKSFQKKSKITKLIITDVIFRDDFLLYNCEVDKCDFKNVTFEQKADFYKSKFLQEEKDINFESINFEGLTIFEECQFKSKAIFQQVTFKSIAQFRNSVFEKGLDLERTNIEKEINFFGVNLDECKNIKETSQETYRIIKYNFDKIGNTIEANKYHACELEKRKNFLSSKLDIFAFKSFKDFYIKHKSYLLDEIVFKLNCFTSQFGRNWFLPVVWIFIVGIVTSSLSDNISLNETFKYMSILTRLKDNFGDSSILFFFNKALLGFLYYQFIVAVRKDTKR